MLRWRSHFPKCRRDAVTRAAALSDGRVCAGERHTSDVFPVGQPESRGRASPVSVWLFA